ncbi:MAG: UDP-2,4-diacetamido-2,4,6-trideoxy-beta-L-altropyranose hydrolase [Methylophaga sp.]|nr:MAG: UDP-2,4-diacetamido-2,4,6-trideoxy-beta-L-altropyranose hydrolase [Methylophaga sp.]
MNIVFRVDSSLSIGIGHLMRCLTLAQELRVRATSIVFISRKHEGNLNHVVTEAGYKLYELSSDAVFKCDDEVSLYAKWLGSSWEEDASQTNRIIARLKIDLLVVDHYALDYKWENIVKANCSKLMVIDDLANRKHDCDVLLDQTYGRVVTDYYQLISDKCILLLGSSFALLRSEFSYWRELSLRYRESPKIEHLIITLGGIDKEDVTGQIIVALKDCHLPIGFELTIVMGANAPHIDNVRQLAKNMHCKTQVLVGITNIAEHMAKNDLAIGAAGSSSWERCCLGLPTLMVVTAENQKNNAKILEQNKAVILVAEPIKLSLIKIFSELTGKVVKNLSTNSAKLVDGIGCERVIDRLKEII